MRIVVESPDGPRRGAEPASGNHTERELVKSLLVTLAVDHSRGNELIKLSIDLSGLEPLRLITIAKVLSQTMSVENGISEPNADWSAP